MKDFEIEGETLINYFGMAEKVIIPDGVKVIGRNSFWGKNMKEVIMPDSVVYIDSHAFYGCENLEKIVFSQKLDKICLRAFGDCFRLKEISFPETIREMEWNVFDRTAWIEERKKENPFVIVNQILIDGSECSGAVTVPDGVVKIADMAFGGNEEMIEIFVPESVAVIGQSAFEYCENLQKLTLPANAIIGRGCMIKKNMEVILYFPDGRKLALFLHDKSINRNMREITDLADIFCLLHKKRYKQNNSRLYPYVKSQLLFQMYMLGINREHLESYLQKHFSELFPYIIEENQIEIVRSIAETGIFFTQENMDSLIRCAIDTKKHEIQIFLMNYKYQHFAFETPADKLKL